MARREVEPDPNFGTGKFLKMKDLFTEIGDKFVGLYQADGEGTYGPEYSFKQKSGEIGTITISNKQLAVQLKKAKLQFNEKVTIEFIDEKDVKQSSNMRIFRVIVEDGPKGAKPPPPPKQEAAEDDWA